MSDCLFFRDVYDAYENYEDGVYFAVLLLSAVFLIIPYLCNVWQTLAHATKIESKLAENPAAVIWFGAYRKRFAWFVALSGGIYPTVALCNSRVFGLDIFTMNLSKREIMAFDVYKLKFSVALENIPQLILQMIYAGVNPSAASSTISFYLALISSLLSILSAVLSFVISRSIPSEYERFTLTIKHARGFRGDVKRIKKGRKLFKRVGKELVKAFKTSKEKLEIVAIAHYPDKTEICMDFTGENEESLGVIYGKEKDKIEASLKNAFKLKFEYKTEFRENQNRWEIEKIRFVGKFLGEKDDNKETLVFDGKECLLTAEMLNSKEPEREAIVEVDENDPKLPGTVTRMLSNLSLQLLKSTKRESVSSDSEFEGENMEIVEEIEMTEGVEKEKRSGEFVE